MAYTPINFKNKQSGGTPVSAANLNHMEAGIAQAHNLVPTESGSVGQVLTKTQNGTSWQDADNLPAGGTEGQVLTRTANSGAEWTDAGNPTASQVAEATGDWLDEHITEIPATAPIVDTSLLVPGAAADSATVGTEIAALQSAIAQGSGLTNEAKTALLELLQHVAYVDDDGQDYYDALETALNPPTNLSYITAVYTQSGTVYDTDSLNSLKSDLVVTAHYSDGTSSVITAYALSGTLAVGTSTVTVTYSGKTTTFNVTVTAHVIDGWYYPFNGSLASSGSKDFNFVGQAVFGEGHDGRQAYYHMVPTAGDSTTDTQLGLKAVNLAEFPDLSGDFTIAYWYASQGANQHHFYMTKYINDSQVNAALVSSATINTPWTGQYNQTNSNKYAGISIQGTASNQLVMRLMNVAMTKNQLIRFNVPSGFDTTAWHHYAITKKGTALKFFVDGWVMFDAVLADENIYEANQIAIVDTFKTTDAATGSDLAQLGYGGKMQDFYVAEFCKWESAFDPESIVY